MEEIFQSMLGRILLDLFSGAATSSLFKSFNSSMGLVVANVVMLMRIGGLGCGVDGEGFSFGLKIRFFESNPGICRSQFVDRMSLSTPSLNIPGIQLYPGIFILFKIHVVIFYVCMYIQVY